MPIPSRVRSWAQRQGVYLHDRHALAVLEILEDTRTALSHWNLVVASHRGWAGARNRSELEQRAIWLGESYVPAVRGGTKGRRVLFLVPKALD